MRSEVDTIPGVLRSIAGLADIPGPLFLAIGVFDGVHLGHQAVIAQVRAIAHARGAKSAVVTFDRHPATVVRPESAGQRRRFSCSEYWSTPS